MKREGSEKRRKQNGTQREVNGVEERKEREGAENKLTYGEVEFGCDW